MRYEDVRRPSGVESFWVHFKRWLIAPSPRRKPMVGNLSHLSDSMRRDLGLPDEVRYVDWRTLRENGWR
jgi:hypothetical protein